MHNPLNSMSFPHVLSGTGSHKNFIESECRTKRSIKALSVVPYGNPRDGLHPGSPKKDFGDDNLRCRADKELTLICEISSRFKL